MCIVKHCVFCARPPRISIRLDFIWTVDRFFTPYFGLLSRIFITCNRVNQHIFFFFFMERTLWRGGWEIDETYWWVENDVILTFAVPSEYIESIFNLIAMMVCFRFFSLHVYEMFFFDCKWLPKKLFILFWPSLFGLLRFNNSQFFYDICYLGFYISSCPCKPPSPSSLLPHPSFVHFFAISDCFYLAELQGWLMGSFPYIQ